MGKRVLSMTTVVEFLDDADYQQYKRDMLELNSIVDFEKLEKTGNLLIKSPQSETLYTLSKATDSPSGTKHRTKDKVNPKASSEEGVNK